MASETLSVRLSPATRKILEDVSAARRIGGASSLAREILEREARVMQVELVAEAVRRLNAHIARYGEMTDDPADFFPAAAEPWE